MDKMLNYVSSSNFLERFEPLYFIQVYKLVKFVTDTLCIFYDAVMSKGKLNAESYKSRFKYAIIRKLFSNPKARTITVTVVAKQL